MKASYAYSEERGAWLGMIASDDDVILDVGIEYSEAAIVQWINRSMMFRPWEAGEIGLCRFRDKYRQQDRQVSDMISRRITNQIMTLFCRERKRQVTTRSNPNDRRK